MSKISVIVPVFNVEKYLNECLKSLICQTFNDIEIICINDGSTDNSLRILEDFSARDDRIKIINQDNYGVSHSRNIGFLNAKSDYIMFLDGDDYYRKEACEIAYLKIKNCSADIGVFGITEKYGLLYLPCIVNKNIKKVCSKNIKPDLWKFQTYSVNKIYKKDFLIQNKIMYPEGIKNAEDTIFSIECLFNNPAYCFVNKPLYVYRKNRKYSATNNIYGVKNDIEALKYFYKTDIFQNQTLEKQLKVIEKFCSGSWNYYKRNKNSKEIITDIKLLLTFIEQHYEIEKLRQFKKYNQIKGIVDNFI